MGDSWRGSRDDAAMAPRRSYADSCAYLLAEGWIEDLPPLLDRRPRHDDDRPGLSFFRTLVERADLSNLTLPRTFIGRSEVRAVSFRNTDLSESTLCWNDFVDVDFRDADLREADLRGADFERCDVTGANLAGALLSPDTPLVLDDVQRAAVVWSTVVPPGG